MRFFDISVRAVIRKAVLPTPLNEPANLLPFCRPRYNPPMRPYPGPPATIGSTLDAGLDLTGACIEAGAGAPFRPSPR